MAHQTEKNLCWLGWLGWLPGSVSSLGLAAGGFGLSGFYRACVFIQEGPTGTIGFGV